MLIGRMNSAGPPSALHRLSGRIRRSRGGHAPSRRPGQIDERLISFIDLAPTILKMAGVERPNYLQGRDFTSREIPPREYIFTSRDRIDEVPDRQRAVRDKRFKYIRSWHPELPGGHPRVFRENIKMVREMRSLYDAGELHELQSRWYQAPGRERLFDLECDPFELNNVVGDPNYQWDLSRLRGALDKWLAGIKDWSEESESAMIERFAPGGVRPVTAMPAAIVEDGTLTIEAPDRSHSVGYRVEEGPWHLYTGQVEVPGARRVEVKAVRYGWRESDIARFQIPR